MANTEVVNLIISTTAEFFTYMLPVIAILAAITFIMTFFMSTLFGIGRRSFKD